MKTLGTCLTNTSKVSCGVETTIRSCAFGAYRFTKGAHGFIEGAYRQIDDFHLFGYKWVIYTDFVDNFRFLDCADKRYFS
jgi:hypothetical protein